MSATYADNTKVSAEKSRAEIEGTLNRFGASEFAYATKPDKAMVAFSVRGRHVRFLVPLPDRNAEAFRYYEHRVNQFSSTKRERTDEEKYKAWEQACRERWRALALAIKAKLATVEAGIFTFEQEFLPHIVLANGLTIAEQILPQLNEVCRSGNTPLLLQ